MGLIVRCLNRVTKSASHIKRQNRFSPLLNYLGALLLSFTPAYGAEVQSSGADSTPRSGTPAHVLTGLSLEQLYNLDVIQLNVIGGHTHPAGQIMFGYEFMFMDMNGHLSGTRDVSESEILKQFPSASTGMTVEEHMVEVMYAPTDNLTLMAMLPIKHIEMDMTEAVAPQNFTEHSDGVGHRHVMALYTVL